MTYVDLPWEEHRPVRVQHDDGTWHDGWLEAYRKDADGWKGWVRYSVAIGAQHIGWFTEDQLRRSSED